MTTPHTANDAPSRELDARVAEALGWTSIYSAEPCGEDWCGRTRDGLHAHVPHYTTDPDGLRPLGEMLTWLRFPGRCWSLTIEWSAATCDDSFSVTTDVGRYGVDDGVMLTAEGASLKHAVALLVLEVASRSASS